MKPAIGFIGIGSMGFHMASHLVRAGYEVTVYNRTAEKLKPLIDLGAKGATRPVDVLSVGSIVFSIVSNDQALEDVVYGEGGLGQGLTKGHIHVSMSTISPQTSRQLATFHQKKGAEYVVATVTGRPEGAAAQTLSIFLSGEEKAKQTINPLLQILGKKIFDLGEDPIAGNIIKLCGNFLISSALEAIGEACAFAEKNGLDRSLIGKVFAQSIFACPIFQIYSPIIAENKYLPAGFKLALGLKDINLLLEAARQCEQPMPLANLVHHRLVSSMAKGREDMDWSAIALAASEDGGKSFD